MSDKYWNGKNNLNNKGEQEMKQNEMFDCPFCGGKAELSCWYDSDDNRPDGEQFFIECGECGAKGPEFYAVTINEMHLNQREKKEQVEQISKAQKNALDAWNRRVII